MLGLFYPYIIPYIMKHMEFFGFSDSFLQVSILSWFENFMKIYYLYLRTLVLMQAELFRFV